METQSRDTIKAMITKDFSDINNRYMEVKVFIKDSLKDTLDYLHDIIAQIPNSASGPLITKTPKVLRKKAKQRIETIPENDVVDLTNMSSDCTAVHVTVENNDITTKSVNETMPVRRKREASVKAADNIKKQQSLSLITKLRRPLSDHEASDLDVKKKKRESQTKRKISTRSSSDEESSKGPRKLTKMEETIVIKKVPEKISDSHIEKQSSLKTNGRTSKKSSTATRSSSRKRTFSQTQDRNSNKQSNIIDDTIIAPETNEIDEPSMYEDAIGKPLPIMNSTMNFNSTYTMQKMMCATVILEPLSAIKLNETVTINKKKNTSTDGKMVPLNGEFKSPRLSSKLGSTSSVALQDRMVQLKEAIANKEFDELLTEDESSPEIKKRRQNGKIQENTKRQKRVTRSTVSSEDEILSTPAKPTLKELNAGSTFQEVKNMYKSNALFSPYAKESVKKRVEAFEQVGMNSPKPAIDIDVPTRMTRTKTRAQAAAQAETLEISKAAEKTVAQKLARKSIAKAKKISLAKQYKDTDKENKIQAKQKVLSEKVKQKQQKTTPLTKTKIQLPSSVTRIPHTPLNNYSNINHGKALSDARTNIITSMDSFLQPPKSVNKCNSTGKVEGKKRKLNDDDAKKKREEVLRLLTEEKKRKRQEKELKNKLAREAKEKQDMEKRQRTEKEREEKARLAQQMLEKQREEIEKKRLAQLQRAMEKEEKRKQEEQIRLQRLQEQEEAERILAEQRRREQEAEKRKEAEARAQQQTAAEAIKTKIHVHGTQTKYGSKHHGPTNYILDSEPDEDESDDESRPKHVIPYWAHPQVRKSQLAMQRYIPEGAVYKFFGSRKCTPDLTKLFQGIDKSRLKRTSSAIWQTPPRFSMMGSEML